MNPFTGVSDPVTLRAALDTLSALLVDIDHDIDTTTRTPTKGMKDRVTGLRTAKVLALRHLRWASAQLHALAPTAPPGQPVLLDLAQLGPTARHIMARQGHPAVAVITAAAVPGCAISTTHLWMPPHHVGPARVHHHTPTALVLHQGASLILWWDQNGDLHEQPHHTGQHVYLPPSVPYALLNPHPAPVIATEFRANPRAHADTETLPHHGPHILAHTHHNHT